MSLILDAINRSQRERTEPGDVPGVTTAHYTGDPNTPGGDGRGWGLFPVVLLIIALIAALGVIAWLLLRDAPPESTSVAGAVTHPAPPRVPAAASVAPAREQSSERAPPDTVTPADKSASGELPAGKPAAREPVTAAPESVPATSPEVAALYAQRGRGEPHDGEPSADRGPPADREPSAHREPSASEAAQVNETPSAEGSAPAEANQAPVASIPPRQEEPLDVEALLAAARQEMEKEQMPDHPAPFLVELSQQRKDAIPTLLYSAHEYRGGGESTVLINGKTARAGQSVGKGVTVEEILPDSAILSFDGQQFRLKALNSWVNL